VSSLTKRKAPPSPDPSDSALHSAKKVAMASDDEDFFDYEDDEELSDMDYDDGDSSIAEGISSLRKYMAD
jgi:hypothetical protein